MAEAQSDDAESFPEHEEAASEQADHSRDNSQKLTIKHNNVHPSCRGTSCVRDNPQADDNSTGNVSIEEDRIAAYEGQNTLAHNYNAHPHHALTRRRRAPCDRARHFARETLRALRDRAYSDKLFETRC